MNLRAADEMGLLRDEVGRLMATHGSALSPVTQATYRNIVRRFCGWHVAQFGTDATTSALSDDVVERYVQWCAMRLSPATIRLRRSALRWVADALAQEQRDVES